MNQLSRKLTLADATFIGLGSMLGAGVFVSFGPAAKAAGTYLGLSIALAGFLAWCNATSSARLAARYPESGGTYVYGTKQLGPLWGFLAGWSFIIGKVSSCVAIALTFGHYIYPANPKLLALAAVVVLTATNYFGVSKSTKITKWLVTFIVLVLSVATLALWTTHSIDGTKAPTQLSGALTASALRGILQGAAFMFFAFAGYARIATLGEEVKSPETAIPKAVLRALSFTLVLYAAIASALVHKLGISGLAQSTAALADATASMPAVHTLVRFGAIAGALSSLLTIILGISRTSFAMARDGNLPHQLANVHPKYRVPHIAEITVGGVVGLLLMFTDLRFAIGFSSFAVLVYYAIANAAAFTLEPFTRSRILPVCGFIGCVAVTLSLPTATVRIGSSLLLAGITLWALQQRLRTRA